MQIACHAVPQHSMPCYTMLGTGGTMPKHIMPCHAVTTFALLCKLMPLFTVRRASLAAPSASFTMRTSAGPLPLRMASVTALQVWCGRGRAREACQGAAMLD